MKNFDYTFIRLCPAYGRLLQATRNTHHATYFDMLMVKLFGRENQFSVFSNGIVYKTKSLFNKEYLISTL